MSGGLKRELSKIERDACKASRTAGNARALDTGGAPKLAKRILRRKITAQSSNRLGSGNDEDFMDKG